MVVRHATTGIALVLMDEVLLQEWDVDDLAPRAVQVDVLGKVTGSLKVPVPPACLWMHGWAMAGPGGELSTHP